MQDRPTTVELLEAIREFLERDVMTSAEGRVRFHTRVAVNALGMLDRELRLGPDIDAAERQRLAALLGHDADLPTPPTHLAPPHPGGPLGHRPAGGDEAG